jgi:hypothetical protein
MKIFENRRLTYEGCLLCSALVFLLGGLGMVIDTMVFLRTADQTMGVVTKMVSTPSDTGGLETKAAVIKFSDRTGRSYELRARDGSSHPRYGVGSNVRIFFRRENPYDFKSDDFSSLWSLTTLVFGIGLLAVVALVRELRLNARRRLSDVPS